MQQGTDRSDHQSEEGGDVTITRAQYVALVEALGLDPSKVLTMRFNAHGIFAEVVADPGDPEVRLFEHGEVAKKPVFIGIEG